MRLVRFFTIILVILAAVLKAPIPIRAQSAPCGVVDALDYPVDGVGIETDDFGMYRAPFGGRHTGIDIAFGRYGEPVRASARGRVTYSDPAGWNAEKGVVIIEHVFPDDSIFFTLYGHMEQTNGHSFPKVGQCVERGQIVGSIGHPEHSAPHLHYEIRTKEASQGGPGYWSSDPLDGGWLNPIDFTEQWRLRLSAAFRGALTAGGAPVAPPLWHADGSATFAEEYHLEQRSKDSQTLWRLDIAGLTGIINLPDGHVLGSTTDNQIILVDTANARFVASWKADRGLRSPPLRLGDSLVFLTDDDRAISYDADGHVRWQTDVLGNHLEHYAQNGDRLAIAVGQDNGYQLWLIDPSGTVTYQFSAPAPIIPVALSTAAPARADKDGFIIMTGNRISILTHDLALKPLMSIGLALGRSSQIALDSHDNVVIYPGQGQQIYSYAANGGLRWQATLPTPQLQPPLLGVGAGCLAYALTSDGSLLAYRAADGALRGLATLYAGGIHGHIAARFLNVSPTDQVQFSAGYLSIATIDGPTLADDCKP